MPFCTRLSTLIAATLAAAAVLVAPSSPIVVAQPAAEPTADAVPANVIAELAEAIKPPPRREGHAEKVRRYSDVIREARGYIAEFAEAPNLYQVQTIMLTALQARMNLEADAQTYRMLLQTAEAIMASKAPPAAKIEADLVLVRDTIHGKKIGDAKLRQTVIDFAGRYQQAGVGEKALMYGAMLAETRGQMPLVNVLQMELAHRREFWDRPGVTGFLRRRVSNEVHLSGRTFNATLRRLDGTTLQAPRDLLGKITLVLFWSSGHDKSTGGIEQLKAFYQKHSDRFEIVGVSLDDDRADVAAFVNEHQLPWIQTFSGRGLSDPTAWTYGVDALPSALVIGPNGRLRNMRGLMGWYGHKPDTSFGSYGGLIGGLEDNIRWYENLHGNVLNYRSGAFLAAMKGGPFPSDDDAGRGLPAEAFAKLRGLVDAIRHSPAATAKIAHAREALKLADDLAADHAETPGLVDVRNAALVAARTLWLHTGEARHDDRALALARAIAENVEPAPRTVLADYVLTSRRMAEAALDQQGRAERIDAYLGRYAQTAAADAAAILGSLLAVEAGDDPLMGRTGDALAVDHADVPQARSFLRYVLGRYVDRGQTFEAKLKRVDGTPLSIPDDFEDKVVMVCFWDAASLQEHRSLPPHPRRYHPVYSQISPRHHEDLVVVGVNLDESPEAAQELIDGDLADWIHTRPQAGWRDALVKRLDIQALPSTWIIGRDGWVVADDVLAARLRGAVVAAAVHQPPARSIRARTVNRWRLLGPFHQRTGKEYTETGYEAAPLWMRTPEAKQAWLNMPWQRSRWFGDQLEKRFSRTAYPPAQPEHAIDFNATYDDGHGKRIGWQVVHGDDYGMIDLAERFPGAPKPAIVYGVTYVHSSTGGEYALAITHNNAITLRVNGEQVLRRTGQDHVAQPSFVWPVMTDPPEDRLHRQEHSPMPMDQAFLDRDWLTVNLRKGWNELFIRAVDVRDTWLFGLRIGDPQRTLRYALHPSETSAAYGDRLPRWAAPTPKAHVRRLIERVDDQAAKAMIWAAPTLGEIDAPSSGWSGWREVPEHVRPHLGRPTLDALTLLGAMHALDLWKPGEALREEFAGANRTAVALKALEPDGLVQRMAGALERFEQGLANLDQVRQRQREHVKKQLRQSMANAVRAVGALDRPEARQWLVEQFRERAAGRAGHVPLDALVDAAGDQGDKVFIELLRPYLQREHTWFLRGVIDAMLRIGIHQADDPAKVEAELLDAIGRADWRGFVTTQKIARVGGERARRRIIASVQGHFRHGMPSHEASQRHVENLANFNHPDVVPEVERFLDHNDQRIRTMAIRTLGELGHDSATPALLKALADPTNGELRHDLIVALGRIGDARARPALIESLAADAYSLRTLAAEALASSGSDAAAVAALVQALDDPHWLVRATAIRTLGTLGAQAAVTPITDALDDPAATVRAAAASTLGELKAASAIEKLVDRLTDWEAGPSVAAALDKLGWQPPAEGRAWVRYHVAARRFDVLADDRDAARAVLAADLKADGPAALNAAFALIALDEDAAAADVAAYLQRSGNPAVAVAMLNAGHEQLAERARAWAAAHDRRITLERAAAIIPPPASAAPQ